MPNTMLSTMGLNKTKQTKSTFWFPYLPSSLSVWPTEIIIDDLMRRQQGNSTRIYYTLDLNLYSGPPNSEFK